ncbi:MAG: large subunit ribosomal protein L15 [Candidatus Peregrinibacteria bacterium Greene0416_19]|nr:MAG: large subunit ribosomal protein L15 [Candidatus Peregrinibacteria bacterium Greene0416_19]
MTVITIPIRMLHTLKPAPGSRFRRKRVARGNAAGGGTTAGRGTKGQQARTGKGRNFGFEGGQVPLLMRQPKLGGFKRARKVTYEVLTLTALDRLEAGAYDIGVLRQKRVIHGKQPVKLLGNGTVKKKYDLTVHAVSKSARDAVQKAGGTVTLRR